MIIIRGGNKVIQSELKALCYETMMQGDVEIWTKGETYTAHEHDNERLSVMKNDGKSMRIEKDFAIMIFKFADRI